MAIHYRVVERKNALPNAKRATFAYAVPKQVGRVNVKELAEDIADRTTLHRADVRAVLDVLSISAMSYLQKGFGVDLGDLGSFSIRLKNKTTLTKDEFGPANILKGRILYTPSVEMKEKLGKVAFSNIENLTEVGEAPSNDPGAASSEEGGTTEPGTGGSEGVGTDSI